MYSTDKTFNTAFKYKYITKPETTNTTFKILNITQSTILKSGHIKQMLATENGVKQLK